MRAVIETAITIVGSLVAFLVFGRYRRRLSPADLGIAGAVAIFALSPALCVGLPEVAHHQLEDVGGWTSLVARVCSAGLLWWASGQSARLPVDELALRPARRATAQRDRPTSSTIVAVPAVALASVVVLLIARYDPDSATATGLSAHAPRPFAQPGVAVIQLICFVLFLGAAVRFSGRRAPTDDRLLDWLSVGSVFVAVASLDYALYPTLDPNQLHLGDVYRVAAVFAFAVGAVAEIGSYWAESSRLARLEERRALARDIHDGVAQELAFLTSEMRTHTASDIDERALERLRAATDRALAESRRAIAALVTEQPLTLGGDLEQALRQLALDTGTSLDLDVQSSCFDPASWEVVVRIVREAVVNAIRHGHAKLVRIDLHGDDAPVLHVIDDGSGFDPSALSTAGDRFGLVAMRERAQSLGGRFSVYSSPGAGTTVEVSWASPNVS